MTSPMGCRNTNLLSSVFRVHPPPTPSCSLLHPHTHKQEALPYPTLPLFLSLPLPLAFLPPLFFSKPLSLSHSPSLSLLPSLPASLRLLSPLPLSLFPVETLHLSPLSPPSPASSRPLSVRFLTWPCRLQPTPYQRQTTAVSLLLLRGSTQPASALAGSKLLLLKASRAFTSSQEGPTGGSLGPERMRRGGDDGVEGRGERQQCNGSSPLWLLAFHFAHLWMIASWLADRRIAENAAARLLWPLHTWTIGRHGLTCIDF